MAYNTSATIVDVNAKPVPQYFNKSKDVYEVVEGSDGKTRTILCDSSGKEIQLTSLLSNIEIALNNLTDVVKRM